MTAPDFGPFLSSELYARDRRADRAKLLPPRLASARPDPDMTMPPKRQPAPPLWLEMLAAWWTLAKAVRR